MKITRKTPEFAPVTIILESRMELDALYESIEHSMEEIIPKGSEEESFLRELSRVLNAISFEQ